MVSKRFLMIAGCLALVIAMVLMVGFVRTQGPPADFDPATYKDHNELLEDVSHDVPEFGGLFLSDGGTVLNVYLTENETNAEKQERTREKVEELFDVEPGLRMNVIKGDYTITQLSAWYTLMDSGGVWDQDGVMATDIQEATNKLYIAVSTKEDIEGVYTFLEGINIPRAAVTVAVEEPMTMASHTVQDRAHKDKMAGGYQVLVDGKDCTLGFVTIKDGTPGMVTAGHCTEAQPYDGGVSSNNQVHQPDANNLIGFEKVDPVFSTSLPGCTDSDGCRYSDSALVNFSSGVQYNRGWIAKPSTDWGISVDPDTAHDSITSDSGGAVVGDEVIKVGRSTGRTRGDVTHTCRNEDDQNNIYWKGTFLCQTRVGVSANKGDSGAPVFKVRSGDSVKLVGILITRSTSDYTFSPLGGVFLDLGSTNSRWDVCTSGC